MVKNYTTMQPAWAIHNGINQNKLHTDSIKQCWNKASGEKRKKKKENPTPQSSLFSRQINQFHHPW